MLDFLLLWRAERNRPAGSQSEPLKAAYQAKLAASLATLEKTVPELRAARFAIGHIGIGVALGYLDFRFPAEDWRQGCPALARWHAEFAARPSVRATEPVDDTAAPLAAPAGEAPAPVQ